MLVASGATGSAVATAQAQADAAATSTAHSDVLDIDDIDDSERLWAPIFDVSPR